MLGPERQILRDYVATGQVRLVFWHNLDGVERATTLHVAAQCLGQQDPILFWKAHDYIYTNQTLFYGVEPAELADIAAAVGGDVDAFQSCYDSGEGRAAAEAIDAITESRSVSGRPVFDIGDTRIFGNQPFGTFVEAIETALRLSADS